MSNYRQPTLAVVSGLIQQDDKVLMVEQQWPDAPKPIWTLPGGRVEENEALLTALTREVKEESGITVLNPGQLLYTLQYRNPERGDRSFIFVFEVAAWEGQIEVNDPDGYILRAEFIARSEAIEIFESQNLWRIVTEPIVSHLRGEAGPGTFWQYEKQNEGEITLTGHLVRG